MRACLGHWKYPPKRVKNRRMPRAYPDLICESDAVPLAEFAWHNARSREVVGEEAQHCAQMGTFYLVHELPV